MIQTLRKKFGRTSIFDTSISNFDFFGTILGGVIIADKMEYSKPITVLSLLLLGQAVHIAVDVQTALNPDGKPENASA